MTNRTIEASEQPHLAEAPRQPAGQRQRDRVGHAEGGDDPGALIGRDAQVARRSPASTRWRSTCRARS